MNPRPFKQVDVFSPRLGSGNALAVVLDAQGLSDEAMQTFARWTQLSETTFILPPSTPQAHYRVRIFTPGGELPFAGHPTLGSCHAWLEQQKLGSDPNYLKSDSDDKQLGSDPDYWVQECGVGLVRIRREGAGLAFAAPPLRRTTPNPARLRDVADALGLHPQQIRAAQELDNGPVWFGLLLDSPHTVLQLKPDHHRLKAMNCKVGVAAAYLADAPEATRDGLGLEVRAFASVIGVDEDPVTGSLNASLAQWLMAEGLMPDRYRAAQGQCLGRAGRVELSRDASGQVWVGGESITGIEGTVRL